jgi:Tfp pilus assembly protein PilO
MKFSIREIILVALTVTIPVGAWWTVYRPNNARNSAMAKEIEARQNKLRELNRVTGTIGDLKMEIASLEKAIQFFRSRLPTEKEIDKVLQEVWQLAESNNLSTKSIRTLDRQGPAILTDASGPYAEQPLSMKLEGPFTGFYGFLLALEARPRIVRLQSMDIEKLPQAKEGSIRADCKLSVFFERSGRK